MREGWDNFDFGLCKIVRESDATLFDISTLRRDIRWSKVDKKIVPERVGLYLQKKYSTFLNELFNKNPEVYVSPNNFCQQLMGLTNVRYKEIYELLETISDGHIYHPASHSEGYIGEIFHHILMNDQIDNNNVTLLYLLGLAYEKGKTAFVTNNRKQLYDLQMYKTIFKKENCEIIPYSMIGNKKFTKVNDIDEFLSKVGYVKLPEPLLIK